MSAAIINLTEIVVSEEIGNVLSTYPDHPYQQAFAHPEMRQKLMAYILSKIPNQYMAIEEEELLRNKDNLSNKCLARRLQIESLVHQGIDQLLEIDAEWINRHIPKSFSPDIEPSHWFG